MSQMSALQYDVRIFLYPFVEELSTSTTPELRCFFAQHPATEGSEFERHFREHLNFATKLR